MTDYVRLLLSAGDGGKGRVSFRREKYVPKGGPDGGMGGDGGNIIIRGNQSLATLADFAGNKHYQSQPGEPGGARKSTGKKGADLVLEVPLGTVIWHIKENALGQTRRLRYGMNKLLHRTDVHQKKYILEKEGQRLEEYPPEFEPLEVIEQQFYSKERNTEQLGVITKHGQELVICQGGFGGRGNDSFKSASYQVPLTAEYGTPGEDRFVALELQLLADVGFAGFPSVGKSTLLSVLTKARPKIAAYPFTTLSPNLGIMEVEGLGERKELVIADIPGLVEGASQGKGLGFDFLRHIKNCKTVVYVLALTEEDLLDTELSTEDKVQVLVDQYQKLRAELDAYDSIAQQKESIICINKIDVYGDEYLDILRDGKKYFDVEVNLVSAATGAGIAEFKKRLAYLDQSAVSELAEGAESNPATSET